MKFYIFSLLLFLFAACSGESEQTNQDYKSTPTLNEEKAQTIQEVEPIEDGFYLILNQWKDSSEVEITQGVAINFNHKFLDGNTEGQPIILEVLVDEYVPLTLKKKPEGVEQPDQRINLLLSMTDSSSLELEAFTEKYVNRQTCIVIGGEAVTMHKIREKIIGGNLQVTRCTDNACQYLLLELEDNVVSN